MNQHKSSKLPFLARFPALKRYQPEPPPPPSAQESDSTTYLRNADITSIQKQQQNQGQSINVHDPIIKVYKRDYLKPDAVRKETPQPLDGGAYNVNCVVGDCPKSSKSVTYCSAKQADSESPRTYTNPTGMTFTSTCRPYTNMKNSVIPAEKCFPGGAYLPVSRYGTAEGDGAFRYKEGGDPYRTRCGRYYFYEPNSSVMLYLGKNVAVFGDKIHACLFLSTIITMAVHATGKQREIIDNALSSAAEINHYVRPFTNTARNLLNAIAVPGEAMKAFLIFPFWNERISKYLDLNGGDKLLLDGVWKWHLSVHKTPQDASTPIQLGNNTFLTNVWSKNSRGIELLPRSGEFDGLDQYLCRMGQFCGLDTIIIQHEPEPLETNTEIIDLRQIPDDYLCRTDQAIYSPPPVTDWANIWFPTQGFIVAEPTGTPGILNYKWRPDLPVRFRDPVFTPEGLMSVSGGMVLFSPFMPHASTPIGRRDARKRATSILHVNDISLFDISDHLLAILKMALEGETDVAKADGTLTYIAQNPPMSVWSALHHSV